jgi:hypothetical protein
MDAGQINTFRHCNSCGTVKVMNDLKRCTGCMAVVYCNRDCQASHWSTHKPQCLAKTLADRIGARIMTPEARLAYESGPLVSHKIAEALGYLDESVQEDMAALIGDQDGKVINIHYDGALEQSKDLTNESIANTIAMKVIDLDRPNLRLRSKDYQKLVDELDAFMISPDALPLVPSLSVKIITLEEAKETMTGVNFAAAPSAEDKWRTKRHRILISTDLNKFGAFKHYIRLSLSPK